MLFISTASEALKNGGDPARLHREKPKGRTRAARSSSPLIVELATPCSGPGSELSSAAVDLVTSEIHASESGLASVEILERGVVDPVSGCCVSAPPACCAERCPPHPGDGTGRSWQTPNDRDRIFAGAQRTYEPSDDGFEFDAAADGQDRWVKWHEQEDGMA